MEMDTEAKICLICGINANKVAKYDRYKILPTKKKDKAGKRKVEDSESDSDDSSKNSKSKKKTPPARIVRAPAASSRTTRNQNPKSFAASLCKAMELPATPNHPFLQIFSRADYCSDCMVKVKDIHASQMELEKVQNRLSEYRVDIELDMSKHLQKIPFMKNVLRNDDYSRYREELDQILDFHGPDKNKNSLDDEEEEEVIPKKQRRQAAINSSLKLKRKLAENEDLSEEEIVVKVSKQERDSDFNLEEPSSDDITEEPETETNGTTVKLEDGVVKQETKVEDTDGFEATPVEAVEIKEEPVPVVKERVKKDPKLKCPHCPIPRYFNIPESLEEHVKRAHLDKKKHTCDICETKFHSVTEVRLHKARAHDIVDTGAGWSCGFCDQDFAQKRYLEDHLDRHEEAKPLNCQYCGRVFKRKDSLKRAFQIYKGTAVDPCNNCSRNLNLKDYLEHNRKLKENN